MRERFATTCVGCDRFRGGFCASAAGGAAGAAEVLGEVAGATSRTHPIAIGAGAFPFLCGGVGGWVGPPSTRCCEPHFRFWPVSLEGSAVQTVFGSTVRMFSFTATPF